jgi:hypothetical protein
MKQKTALAQAIEQILYKNKQSTVRSEYTKGREDAFLEVLHVLRTLKPIERQQIEDFVADRNSTSNIELSIKEMFDKNLTQD